MCRLLFILESSHLYLILLFAKNSSWGQGWPRTVVSFLGDSFLGFSEFPFRVRKTIKLPGPLHIE